MNYRHTFELRHLASGDYDTLCDRECTCGNHYDLQYHSACDKCKRSTIQSEPNNDVMNMVEEDGELECGSIEEHLKRNSCPKKHGKIGDIHYELYVQQSVVIDSDSFDEAWKKSTLESELDKYLQKNNVGFGSEDFEGDFNEFYVKKTTEPIGVGDMRIVHEKVYYDNE